MKFPIAIHKDEHSDFGVTVPDLPGCFSAGNSLEDAMLQTEEAILCHLEGLLSDNEPIPQPKMIESHKENKEFEKCIWAIVSVDLEKISGKAKRVNITIPERILSQIDEYAMKTGDSRSGLLTQAALEYIHDHKR
ncbi:MAG: type II toxin-antitoxin system HicB family antitoxin [Leptospiraceae bacterium]|nr:type II toxin-antitoxin system HicB family antitoxin [Leptospiraceae bacterium]